MRKTTTRPEFKPSRLDSRLGAFLIGMAMALLVAVGVDATTGVALAAAEAAPVASAEA